jgi:hypothetical protein
MVIQVKPDRYATTAGIFIVGEAGIVCVGKRWPIRRFTVIAGVRGKVFGKRFVVDSSGQ